MIKRNLEQVLAKTAEALGMQQTKQPKGGTVHRRPDSRIVIASGEDAHVLYNEHYAEPLAA